MARTRVRWRRVAIAAACSFVAVGSLAGRARAGGSHYAAPHVYVVRAGDTLWSIAAALVGPREDPRPMVQRLIQTNHVRDGLIRPGQEIRLP